jgi:hypothetical protein
LKSEYGKEDFPDKPGVFALPQPYLGMCVALDTRCPAQYVNDCKGLPGNPKANINFFMHPAPITLLDGSKGLQMMLQARTLCEIAVGEQLFYSYGDKFWAKTGEPIGDIQQDDEDPGYCSEYEEEEKEMIEIDLTLRKDDDPEFESSSKGAQQTI